MYDTSPHSPLKGDIRQLWPEDIRIKELESLFDLDPALEETLDFSEFDTANPNPVGAPPPVVPDSAVVTTSVASGGGSVNLLTLTAAATTEHLARLEGQGPAIFTFTTGNTHAVAAASAAVTSPVSLPITQQAPVSEVFDLMPQFNPGSTPTSTPQEGEWGGQAQASPFSYTTVKTEDLTLSTLTACSMEASLPGFTSTVASVCKSEPLAAQDDSCSQFTILSPRSTRSLSESSTATTSSTMPDSPRRPTTGKGGRSRRRQAPKDSNEYKEKRARNNIAVRKSRAKAKEKQKMTEGRVKELLDLNESLHKRLEMLTKEVTVLKGLFMNVGASLPDDFSKLMEVS